MISETYNWFAHSTIRRLKYNRLFECINVGEQPLKLLKLSDTRWLSIAACVQRVLDQYDELKLHFQIVKDELRDYTAELLYQMFSSPENKLYLMILRPILQELNRVNKLFESDQASPVKLLTELLTLYENVILRIVRPTTIPSWGTIIAFDLENRSKHLPSAAINFDIELNLLLHDSKIELSLADQIKERCRHYLLQLLRELRQRLSANVEQLESVADLSPSVILGAQKSQLSKLSFLPLYKGNLGDLEQQWMRISLISWPHYSDNEVEQFWITVANHADACRAFDFLQMGHFALCVLALPYSIAAVERTFSQVNQIKRKLRNRMGQGMMEALLRVRSCMKRNGICCNGFVPSTAMLSNFNSKIYATTESADHDEDVLPEEYFEVNR